MMTVASTVVINVVLVSILLVEQQWNAHHVVPVTRRMFLIRVPALVLVLVNHVRRVLLLVHLQI
jgi:hypothetical protein